MRVAGQKGGRWRIEMCCQVQRVAARMMAGSCNAAVAHACFWLSEGRPSQRLGVMLISVFWGSREGRRRGMKWEAAARPAKRREAAKECRGRSTTRVQNLDPSHSTKQRNPQNRQCSPTPSGWERGKWRKGLARPRRGTWPCRRSGRRTFVVGDAGPRGVAVGRRGRRVVSRKGLQVLLAGWQVGGGRVTVLSTKGPRASRHGHLRTWTACANRCPEVSFPPAGRRQRRPTFPRSPPGRPGTVEPTTPSASPTNPKAGTVGQHQHPAPATPPTASLPRQKCGHGLARDQDLFVRPYIREVISSFGQHSRRTLKTTIFTSFVQGCQMHLGQSRGDIIHL